jgi:glycerophosphoryl diester phosphodiesterase
MKLRASAWTLQTVPKLAVALLGLTAIGLPVRATAPPPEGAAPTRPVAACLRDPQCHQTFVVAHRARGFGAPENSVEGVKLAIDHGVPLVKIDLRVSRDGEIFVFHDPTLARTTGQRGRVDGLTADELRQVRLPNGEPLPRFDEMYRRFAGRVVFVLDCKVDVIERVAEWVAQNGSLDDVVFLVGLAEHMRSLARARSRHPAVMAAARLTNWWDLALIWELFRGPPEVIHTDLTSPADLAEVRRRAKGAKVFVKALDAESRIWPFGELAVEGIVDARPELILTDDPGRFQRRLRERGSAAS